jgi:electron-transferring-flavoprotein dehydrogenase
MRLKGIHLAMRTGMLAGETAYEALRAGDTSAAALKRYQERIDGGPVRAELYPVRSVHQGFDYGLIPGLLLAGIALTTKGRLLPLMGTGPGHERMETRASYHRPAKTTSEKTRSVAEAGPATTFDKLTDVHYSGTSHGEDQPAHLLVHTEVCSTICGPEYGHPCIRFCPANVYEIAHEADGTPRLQINASNCVHCKTCDIMDPYQVITWVPPEGGGGPQYNGM